MVCSNSATIEAGPHVSILYLACSRPELWPTLCTAVQSKEPLALALCRVYRKRNGFEAKTLPLALESDESLLLKVEPIARLPMSIAKTDVKACETVVKLLARTKTRKYRSSKSFLGQE